MTANLCHVFFVGPILIFSVTQALPAQETPEQIRAKLKAINKSIEELHRKEIELLQTHESLRQKLHFNVRTQKQAAEKAKDDAWNTKHRPRIELRAKLRSRTTSNLLFPPTVITFWSIQVNGKDCHLNFGDTPQPFELRDEQDVEVLIKGTLEVGTMKWGDHLGLFREITTLTIHVESLKKAPKD